MFTHIHGTGYEARKKENGCDSLKKIRMSFRILPRYNVQDFTEQLTLDEFKTVKYAVCMRQHFQGVDGTYYYLIDFYENNFQSVFFQKLNSFLRICVMLCPHKMLNKCKVCIKSDFWKIKRKSKRISQTFNFSVSNMELRSGLYQFIKENDYEPEPYTLKSDIDSFPGSTEYSNLKMIGKK